MNAIERWESLKARLAKLREEESRRAGSEETLLRQLKEEFGVSFKEAEREILSLRKQVESLEKQLDEKIEEIEVCIENGRQ